MGNLNKLLATFEPRSPWFGAGRSIVALAQMSILVFTTPDSLLQTVIGLDEGPRCGGYRQITLYCLGGEILTQETRRWVMVAMLLSVVIGYLPRCTAILHLWVSFSLGWSITLPDGGEQVARIVVMFFLLIAIADDRRWHWKQPQTPRPVILSGLALAGLLGVRVQMSMIYLHAAVSKLWTEDWLNGSAEYYTVRDPMFGASGFIYTVMHWVTSQPIGVAILTWGAILIELAIGVLILTPARGRLAALALDVMLHGFIIATIGLWSFALVMIGATVVAAAPHTPESDFLRRSFKNLTLRFDSGRTRNLVRKF